MVKIIGISGSPRLKGNTVHLINKSLEVAKELGAETELIRLGNLKISPCTACNKCKKTGKCSIEDDMLEILEKVEHADGLIIGSPVYFGTMTAQLKIFVDRSRPLRSRFALSKTVAGAIAVGASRNGGQETTISTIHEFLFIQDAIVVGDGSPTAHYGGTGHGSDIHDCETDEFGLNTAKNLGRRVTELAIKLNK